MPGRAHIRTSWESLMTNAERTLLLTTLELTRHVWRNGEKVWDPDRWNAIGLAYVASGILASGGWKVWSNHLVGSAILSLWCLPLIWIIVVRMVWPTVVDYLRANNSGWIHPILTSISSKGECTQVTLLAEKWTVLSFTTHFLCSRCSGTTELYYWRSLGFGGHQQSLYANFWSAAGSLQINRAGLRIVIVFNW